MAIPTALPSSAPRQEVAPYQGSSIGLPLSLLGGAAAGAKIGLNLCTIWAPVAPFGSSSFCLFYVMPHCAIIGVSLVYITYAFAIAPGAGGSNYSYSDVSTSNQQRAKSRPAYIEDALSNGDCLLHAALKHMHRDRYLSNNTAAEALRREIAETALQTTSREQQMAIIYDIADARNIARRENSTHILPYSHLFSDDMNRIFISDPAEIAWDAIIGQAYNTYLLTPEPKAYLDKYALSYLNERIFNGRLLIVQSNGQDGYINRDAPLTNPLDRDDQDRLSLPVLLRDGEHYQYIDSSDPAFWLAYRPR